MKNTDKNFDVDPRTTDSTKTRIKVAIKTLSRNKIFFLCMKYLQKF